MRINVPLVFSVFLSTPFYSTADEEIIVITADRLAVNELKSAYSTKVIYDDEIIKQGFRTTVDAIASVSGVLLQKTAHGQGSPYIRGFTGFRNLFLIDGIRLNNSIFREGPNQYWNTVDPLSIGRFEVVKGPTSVAYGSDAIGGTVNAITRIQSIDDLNTETPVSLYYRGSTAEQSHQIRAFYQQQIGSDSAFTLGITGKSFGDLIAGRATNEQPNTGYDEYNIDSKWLHKLSDDWLLSGAYFKTKQNDVPRTHKTIHAISYAGTTIGEELKRDLDQERELIYIKLSTPYLSQFADAAEFTLSYQNQNENRDRLRTNNRSDFQSTDVKTLGINSFFNKQFQANNLIYGLEYYHDDVDSFSSKNDIQGPVADDASYQWLGIYTQNKHTLNTKTDIDIGIRWNYMAVNANKISNPVNGEILQLNNHWQNIIGNLRLNYQVTPEHKSIYIGLSQGFRAPNLSDLTRFDSARSNEFEIPALDLDSEHYIIFDSGLKFRSEKIDYDISLYYTDIKDQIQRVPTGNQNEDGEFEITKMNLGDGYAFGGELDINYRFNEQLTFLASMAYIKGKVDTYASSEQIISQEYLSRIMPTNARLAVNFIPESTNWWLNSEVIAFDKADRLSTRDSNDSQRIPPQGTPGYIVWNISSGYVFSPSLLLTVNLNNIFDKNYRTHGSGQNEAGMNFIASLSYSF